jgi:hypothetical protein
MEMRWRFPSVEQEMCGEIFLELRGMATEIQIRNNRYFSETFQKPNIQAVERKKAPALHR